MTMSAAPDWGVQVSQISRRDQGDSDNCQYLTQGADTDRKGKEKPVSKSKRDSHTDQYSTLDADIERKRRRKASHSNHTKGSRKSRC